LGGAGRADDVFEGPAGGQKEVIWKGPRRLCSFLAFMRIIMQSGGAPRPDRGAGQRRWQISGPDFGPKSVTCAHFRRLDHPFCRSGHRTYEFNLRAV